MFELRGIEKRFGAVVALNGASLSVQPGEIHALLGSNGSGKSTMIKVLAGLVNPNAGEVVFDPEARSMPDWRSAPEAYWKAPGLLRGWTLWK